MSGKADWASKDYYAVLGVSKDAGADEVKKAYRRLARANHPDSNPGDDAKHEKFKSIAEAYDVVGDADKRREYDEIRSAPRFPTGGGQGGFDINDFFGQRGAGQGRGHPAGGGGMGDMFGDLFGGSTGGRSRQPRPQRGSDVESSATISFEDAMDGVTISLRLTNDAPCPTCSGTGGKPGTRPHICSVCDGAGMVASTSGGAFTLNETCPGCGGRQLVYDEMCPTCHGSGRGQAARSLQARIPAGVKDGQKIRLRGKGGSGSNGGPAGDLFVHVKVSPHRLFARKGDNLTVDVPVGFDEAALGAEIKVPTLKHGPVTLKMPSGTPNGRTFRVRGKGAKKSDGTNGDLLVTVQVQVPAVLDAAAREAVEAYREAMVGKPLRGGLFEEA